MNDEKPLVTLNDWINAVIQQINEHTCVSNLGPAHMPTTVDATGKSITIKLPHAIDFIPLKISMSDAKVNCDHVWKTYDSGWSKYDYCTTCDQKRNS